MEPVWSASGIGRNSRSCGAYCHLGGNSVADGVCAQGRKPEHIAGVEPVWSASGIGRVPAPLVAAGKKKRNFVRDCANRCRRNRTFNLRIKSPMLCQLSYAPLKRPYEWWDSNPHAKDTGT